MLVGARGGGAAEGYRMWALSRLLPSQDQIAFAAQAPRVAAKERSMPARVVDFRAVDARVGERESSLVTLDTGVKSRNLRLVDDDVTLPIPADGQHRPCRVEHDFDIAVPEHQLMIDGLLNAS